MIEEIKKMQKFHPTGSCPIRDVLSRLGDKWSMLVLVTLNANGTMRFSDIHKTIGDIFVKCCTKILEIPVIIIKFLIKWLLFPVKRCKLLWYKAYNCAIKGRLANWVILRKGRKKRK